MQLGDSPTAISKFMQLGDSPTAISKFMQLGDSPTAIIIIIIIIIHSARYSDNRSYVRST
jgi:high-affinity nickel permease